MTVDPKGRSSAADAGGEGGKLPRLPLPKPLGLQLKPLQQLRKQRRKRLPLRPKHRPEPPPLLRRPRVLPLKSRRAIHPRGGHSSSARW